MFSQITLKVNDTVRVADRAAYVIGESGVVLAVCNDTATVLMKRPNTDDLAHRIPVVFLEKVESKKWDFLYSFSRCLLLFYSWLQRLVRSCVVRLFAR